MIQAAHTLSCDVGKKAACQALEVSRATYYRQLNPVVSPETERPLPPLALNDSEKQGVLDVLHSERFQDKAPLQVYASLLDDGRYLCSTRRGRRVKRGSRSTLADKRTFDDGRSSDILGVKDTGNGRDG